MNRRNLPRGARCKPGQLKLKYGAIGRDEPDLITSWGDGVPKGSGRMLYSVLSSKSYNQLTLKWEPSPLEVLEKWGFDLKTLRIEIKHKDFIDE